MNKSEILEQLVLLSEYANSEKEDNYSGATKLIFISVNKMEYLKKKNSKKLGNPKNFAKDLIFHMQ